MALRLQLGTRASALARWQANWVAEQLRLHGIDVELVPIATQGDTSPQERIGKIGSPGVFTKELQRALLDKRIDLSVHSLKDLPTDEVPGLALVAVPPRESPFDVLISRGGQRLDDLPQGAVIGTESLRRRAQLLFHRRDLVMADIRGNVDTRLQKLQVGQYDALVLAEAGLNRLGLGKEITEVLSPLFMLPAVGQGALAVEARSDDESTRAALVRINHALTHQAVLAERTMLAALRGGCLAPVGAWGRIEADGRLHLSAVVLSHDGGQRLTASGESEPAEAVALGQRVAEDLLSQGADRLIAASRAAT